MIIWNRLKYVLSPQFDIYENIYKVVSGNVADIGCGTGFGTHLLTINSDNVHGYEVDDGALDFSKKVFPINSLQFLRGDIQEGIESDILYNFIIMIDVIEHLENDKKALENV